MKNPAASARTRLLTYAQQNGLVFNDLLTRYTLEGFLARLSASSFAEQFVLKGGMLYPLWERGAPVSRATRDLDLLARGSVEPQRILSLFQTLDSSDASAEDGLVFAPELMVAGLARENQHYQGIKLDAAGQLGSATVKFHVDIGFGDSVYPAVQFQDYPRLLALTPARLRTYPVETVVAEKFQAMVMLGLANSRMKDFYDLAFLSGRFEFDAAILHCAMRGTFSRRQTSWPTEKPVALSATFFQDVNKQKQWTAFLRKNRFPESSIKEVVEKLDAFLWPLVTEEARADKWDPATRSWRAADGSSAGTREALADLAGAYRDEERL